MARELAGERDVDDPVAVDLLDCLPRLFRNSRTPDSFDRRGVRMSVGVNYRERRRCCDEEADRQSDLQAQGQPLEVPHAQKILRKSL